MADVFKPEIRSQIMRAVKSKRNKSTEEKLITILRKNKITGWRRNYSIYGKPDFVFLKEKIAIFADGCFWHGHNCRKLKPQSNKQYWDAKIERNKKRDKEVNKYLRKKGWEVIRIWECEIEKPKFINRLLKILTLKRKNIDL